MPRLWCFVFPTLGPRPLSKKSGNCSCSASQEIQRNHAEVRRAAQYVREGKLGGVLYLQRNIRSRHDVARINNLFKDASPGVVPLIAIDHEGGAVQRLRDYLGYTRLPSARRMAQQFHPQEAAEIYGAAATELAQTGFTLNLGPVVDLHDPGNRVIGKAGRAYDTDPTRIAAYAQAFVKAYEGVGILSALKHFPGHGRSRGDSHYQSVDITATWKPDELDPYRSLFATDDVRVVMSGHLTHAHLTGGVEPATFSQATITRLLRDKMGYRGIAMTDDLTMAGARRHGTIIETMIKSLQAGHDLLLVAKPAGSSGSFIDRAIAGIGQAVLSGQLDRSVIDTAYLRVMKTRRAIT